jgi:hypothetical protein
MKQRIFISSVQMEFAEAGQALKAYLLGDALLSRFFELAFVAVGGQVTEQGEPQPESRPESRPESLEVRVLRLLTASPLGKAELSSGLGQKEISGQLNKGMPKLRIAGGCDSRGTAGDLSEYQRRGERFRFALHTGRLRRLWRSWRRWTLKAPRQTRP